MAKNVQAPGSNIGLIRRSSMPYGTENSRGGLQCAATLEGRQKEHGELNTIKYYPGERKR